MEAEEEVITSTLERRLEMASQQQEVIVSTLSKQLEQLKNEKAKLHSEKINLENHLEAEQEFIMNKLQKQVEKIRAEKMSLAKEKSDLRSHVLELTSSVEKLKRDKVSLEQEMEMEEENITNRLQRQVRVSNQFTPPLHESMSIYRSLTLCLCCIRHVQVDALLATLRQVDIKLQGRGLSLSELGIALPTHEIPVSMPRRSSGSVPIVSGALSAMGSLSRNSYGSSFTPTSPRFLSGSSPVRSSSVANNAYSPGAGMKPTSGSLSRPTSGHNQGQHTFAPRGSGSGTPGSVSGSERGTNKVPLPLNELSKSSHNVC